MYINAGLTGVRRKNAKHTAKQKPSPAIQTLLRCVERVIILRKKEGNSSNREKNAETRHKTAEEQNIIFNLYYKSR
jgi:hypothetical protein